MDHSKHHTILSVSELNLSIKSILENQYRFIHVRGEISNLRIPYSGHMYFTLKDSSSQIRCVLFKQQQRYLAGEVKEGQSIVCHGRLSVYEPRGEYQIIIDTVDFAGAGNLQIQFEKLKAKLREKGYFSSEMKKKIAPFPDKIALITSPGGAAVHDFLKIAEKRSFWGDLIIIPVAVQGKKSSAEISEAIRYTCDEIQPDIIVLLRGGGSIEDLWSFNEEGTADAIHNAAIPVVTGIGHETDFTIADMCADLHTHTPTAAAEALLVDKKVLVEKIDNFKHSLIDEIYSYFHQKEETIAQLSRLMGDMDLYLANRSLQLDYQVTSLLHNTQKQIAQNHTRLKLLRERLHRQAPVYKIEMQNQKLQHLKKELVSAFSMITERRQEHLGKLAALLDSRSPLAILARGYSIVSKTTDDQKNEKIIHSTNQVVMDDQLHIKLHEGSLECRVTGIDPDGSD